MSPWSELYDLPPDAMAAAVQEALFRRYGQRVSARGWCRGYEPCVEAEGVVGYESKPGLSFDRRDGAFVVDGRPLRGLCHARHVEIEAEAGQDPARFAFADGGAIAGLADVIEAHWDGLDKPRRWPVMDAVVETPQGTLVTFVTHAACVLHPREHAHALRYNTGALVTAKDLCLHLSDLGVRAAIALSDEIYEASA